MTPVRVISKLYINGIRAEQRMATIRQSTLTTNALRQGSASLKGARIPSHAISVPLAVYMRRRFSEARFGP